MIRRDPSIQTRARTGQEGDAQRGMQPPRDLEATTAHRRPRHQACMHFFFPTCKLMKWWCIDAHASYHAPAGPLVALESRLHLHVSMYMSLVGRSVHAWMEWNRHTGLCKPVRRMWLFPPIRCVLGARLMMINWWCYQVPTRTSPIRDCL